MEAITLRKWVTRKRLAVAAVGLGTLLVFSLLFLLLARPLIPSSLRQEVSFVIFYPGKSNPAKVDRSSFRYNSSKILTYTAKLGATKLTITNQATPEAFTDIPQVYDKVVEGMHPYASFDGSSGKVSLTHPPNSNNQQVAVANNQGTLMFVRASKDLSDDQWRKFFNNLSTVK